MDQAERPRLSGQHRIVTAMAGDQTFDSAWTARDDLTVRRCLGLYTFTIRQRTDGTFSGSIALGDAYCDAHVIPLLAPTMDEAKNELLGWAFISGLALQREVNHTIEAIRQALRTP